MKNILACLALVAGCSFHVDGADGGADLSSSGGDDLAPGDGDDLATGGSDLAMSMGDMGPPLVCTPGATSCSGSTLTSCPDGSAQQMTTCPLGCSTTGGAHCNVVYPRAPITRNDFDTTGLSPVTLTANSVYIGADNGLIGPANAPFRHANADASAYEVHDGVGFHLVAIPGTTLKLGIYTFKSLTVNANVVVNAYGTNAIALVSAGDLTMSGTFDATGAGNVNLAALAGGGAQPWLAGPGGGNGGHGMTAPVAMGTGGAGASADSTHNGGGGGGGYADTGGIGGADGNNTGGAAGVAYGAATLSPLVGGSGGGAGGGPPSGAGGGGGGLAVFVAQGTLTIGSAAATGGVNAGGGGGLAANNAGGGGGGAGGAILVQAPTVHVAAMGVLAANGGGGGAGNTIATATSNGQRGQLGATAANGGTGTPSGGDGGAGATTSGTPGGTATNAGGGGGGAVGRIRIESQSGSATVDGGGVTSPSAAQGPLDIH